MEILRYKSLIFWAILTILFVLLLESNIYASTEVAKLLASDGGQGDRFGWSVSISGDVALIGAYDDENEGSASGSAYVFRWDGSSWIEEQKLLAPDGATGDYFYFGWSVSISGDVAVVGAQYDDDNGDASGSVYIFRWNGNSWVLEQKLLASDGDEEDHFGQAVSVSGDVVLIGAYGDEDNGPLSGSAYVFRWNGSSWIEEQKLFPSGDSSYDFFSYQAVSISGDVALIGANMDRDNGQESGSAYIFRWNGSSWVQEQKLFSSDISSGDKFGCSVSISGDVALVGAWHNIISTTWGSAYVFRLKGRSWVEEQKLFTSGNTTDGRFGISVSINGDVALVGAYKDRGYAPRSGTAYVFRWNGNSWIEELKLLASDGAQDRGFGRWVSVSGDVAFIGAYADSSVYAFDLIQADLAISQTDRPDPILAGDNLTYTLDIKNNGPFDATGVIVTDTLPANVNFFSATPTQGSCSESLGTVTCNLGDLAKGFTATIAIVVSPVAEGLIANTADVTCNESDTVNTNNSATANTIIHPTIPPLLSLAVPVMATESDGALLGQGTVNISGAISTNLRIYLSSSDRTEVLVPSTVVIPNGSTTANFDLTIVDDGAIDGTQTETITASVPNWTPVSSTIEVVDNEQMELFLSIPSFAVEGDGTAQGTLSIPGTFGSDLVVTLNSSDTSEITVPAAVVITTGHATSNFDLTIIDDSTIDGTQTISVTASAFGWGSVGSTMDILDNDDSDADTLPDWWEIQYFGDLSQEGAGDYDKDGINNLDEYNDQSNPANENPDQPILFSPANFSINAVLTPAFETNPFSDPDGDAHENTVWEIRDQSGLVFSVRSTRYLTELALPDFILNENTQYLWQARFEDEMGAKSLWSDEWELTTGADPIQWTNGVPDHQALDPNDPVQNTLDLNGDGTEDINQPQHENWKCLNAEIGEGQIGIEGKDANNVDSVDSVMSIDPAGIANSVNMPDIMPFGLVTFKLSVVDSDQPATVKLYSTIDIPSDAKIYKYSPDRGWYVYPHAVISRPPNDYHYVEMSLWDGGDGDADGLKNGSIIDPVGAGVVVAVGGGGGGGGGGG